MVKHRSGLSFEGDRRFSVIRQKRGAPRIATFEGVSDVLISKLTFDANGIARYGGVVFYAATGIRIEQNVFIDSAPKASNTGDHYSFVFGKGREIIRDINILNNVIEDLQLEVDHAKNVIIRGNVVKRAQNTAAIGIFTVGDNAVAETYLITENVVIDPPKIGLNAGLDPPTSQHCLFRRIHIIDNQIIRTRTAGSGVRIGTPDNSKATTGNIFEDIIIKGNIVRVNAGAPRSGPMIFANTSGKAGVVFDRLQVIGNEFDNRGPVNKGYGIDLRGVKNSIVATNTLKRVASGISLSGNVKANEVRGNTVEAIDIAYRLRDSIGENNATNNRVIGRPRQTWDLSNTRASDTSVD